MRSKSKVEVALAFGVSGEKTNFLYLFLGLRIAVIEEKWTLNILDYHIKHNLGERIRQTHTSVFRRGGVKKSQSIIDFQF